MKIELGNVDVKKESISAGDYGGSNLAIVNQIISLRLL